MKLRLAGTNDLDSYNHFVTLKPGHSIYIPTIDLMSQAFHLIECGLLKLRLTPLLQLAKILLFRLNFCRLSYILAYLSDRLSTFNQFHPTSDFTRTVHSILIKETIII